MEEAASEVGTGLAFFTIAEAMGLFGNVSSKAISLGEKRNECFILRHAVHSWIGEITSTSCLLFFLHTIPQQYSYQDSSYANFETLVAFVETALHRKGYKPALWKITLSMSVVSKSFIVYIVHALRVVV